MADFKLSYTASEINEKLGKVTTPDWNQEKPTGKGYIKNKPFGSMNGTVEFLNNGVSTSAATYESDYEGPKFVYLKDLKLNLTVGESYTAILTRQDGSTEEISIIASPIDTMDDDVIDDILYSTLDPMDELDIDIDQIIGIDSIKQKLKDDIVFFSDETSELFMGFSGVWADFENYILKYEPFTTTYAIMDPDIVSIKLECSTSKPISAKLLSTRPDWNQNDPTAPDYIKNRPFGVYQFINFENKDYSGIYRSVDEEDDPGCVFTLNDRGILECKNFKTPNTTYGLRQGHYFTEYGLTCLLRVDLRIPTSTSEYIYEDIRLQGPLHSKEDEEYNDDSGDYCYEQYIGNLFLRDESLPDTGEDFLFYQYAGDDTYKLADSEVIAIYLRPEGKFEDQWGDEISISSYVDYMTGGNTYKYPRNVSIYLGIPDTYYQPIDEEFLPEDIRELPDIVNNLRWSKTDSNNIVNTIDRQIIYDSTKYLSVNAFLSYLTQKMPSTDYTNNKAIRIKDYDALVIDSYSRGSTQYNNTGHHFNDSLSLSGDSGNSYVGVGGSTSIHSYKFVTEGQDTKVVTTVVGTNYSGDYVASLGCMIEESVPYTFVDESSITGSKLMCCLVPDESSNTSTLACIVMSSALRPESQPDNTLPLLKNAKMTYCNGSLYITGEYYKNASGDWVSDYRIYKVDCDFPHTAPGVYSFNIKSISTLSVHKDYDYLVNMFSVGSRIYFQTYNSKQLKYIDVSSGDAYCWHNSIISVDSMSSLSSMMSDKVIVASYSDNNSNNNNKTNFYDYESESLIMSLARSTNNIIGTYDNTIFYLGGTGSYTESDTSYSYKYLYRREIDTSLLNLPQTTTQPSYDENDPLSPEYIKNRPFYEKEEITPRNLIATTTPYANKSIMSIHHHYLTETDDVSMYIATSRGTGGNFSGYSTDKTYAFELDIPCVGKVLHITRSFKLTSSDQTYVGNPYLASKNISQDTGEDFYFDFKSSYDFYIARSTLESLYYDDSNRDVLIENACLSNGNIGGCPILYISIYEAEVSTDLKKIDPKFVDIDVNKVVRREVLPTIYKVEEDVTDFTKYSILKKLETTLSDETPIQDAAFINGYLYAIRNDCTVMKINLDDMSSEIVKTLDYYCARQSGMADDAYYSGVGIGVIGNRIYYVNDYYESSSRTTHRLYYYDVETNEEVLVMDLDERLLLVNIVAVGTTLYFLGGISFQSTSTSGNTNAYYYLRNTVYAYDTVKEKYYDTGIPYQRSVPGVPYVMDDKIYIFGGGSLSFNGAYYKNLQVSYDDDSSKIHIIDIAKGVSYESPVQLPNRSLLGAVASSLGHKIYVFSDHEEEDSYEIYVYDTTDDTIEVLDDKMSVYEPCATRVGDRIYLLGGQLVNGAETNFIHTLEYVGKMTNEISENSTDKEIPTAKSVYNYVNNLHSSSSSNFSSKIPEMTSTIYPEGQTEVTLLDLFDNLNLVDDTVIYRIPNLVTSDGEILNFVIGDYSFKSSRYDITVIHHAHGYYSERYHSGIAIISPVGSLAAELNPTILAYTYSETDVCYVQKLLDNSSISTAITENSLNTEVASALATKNYIDEQINALRAELQGS